jgi:hypothetical protein
MKKTACFAILAFLILGVGSLSWAEGLRPPPGGYPASATPVANLEATNTLLNAATTYPAYGTAVDLYGSAVNHSYYVLIKGLAPTNVGVKIQGSPDGNVWVDLDTQTVTPNADKINNGTFTGAATNWTLNTGWAYGTNNVAKTGDGLGALVQADASMASVKTAGEYYCLRYTTSSFTVGTITPSFGGFTCPAVTTTNAIQECCGLTTSVADLSFTPTNSARLTIDDVSLRVGGTGYYISAKPWRYIRGAYTTRSSGDATTSVTIVSTSSAY